MFSPGWGRGGRHPAAQLLGDTPLLMPTFLVPLTSEFSRFQASGSYRLTLGNPLHSPNLNHHPNHHHKRPRPVEEIGGWTSTGSGAGGGDGDKEATRKRLGEQRLQGCRGPAHRGVRGTVRGGGAVERSHLWSGCPGLNPSLSTYQACDLVTFCLWAVASACG